MKKELCTVGRRVKVKPNAKDFLNDSDSCWNCANGGVSYWKSCNDRAIGRVGTIYGVTGDGDVHLLMDGDFDYSPYCGSALPFHRDMIEELEVKTTKQLKPIAINAIFLLTSLPQEVIFKYMKYSTTTLAKKLGVTTETIRRWVREGKLEADRTEGGHLRVKYNPDQEVILYGRVSSIKQLSSIATQEKLLLERYPNEKFIFDIGSGFNFKRRKFVSILERVLSGDPVKLVATTPDRVSRSGLSLIVKIIEFQGGTTEFLEDEDKPESFDIATLIAFLTSFCNSQSGKRSKRRHKKNTPIPEGREEDV